MGIVLRVLRGPIIVSYRQVGKKHYATALQFDLVGVGASRRKAFEELQGVVNAYLTEALKTDEPLEFFFPTEPEEWEQRDQEQYLVIAYLVKALEGAQTPDLVPCFEDLRPFRDRIRSFDLLRV